MRTTIPNNYTTLQLTEGLSTEYNRPLMLVAMENGQADQVSQILNEVGLVIEEKEKYPFFKLIDRRAL